MNVKVLIVDDEANLPLIIKDYLEDETDFEVILVSSGEEGLAILDKEKPDICIVDMRLPKMNGNYFILKAHENLPGCKFIIHTGSIDYTVPLELLNIGLTDESVIYKPVSDLAEFNTRILKVLQ